MIFVYAGTAVLFAVLLIGVVRAGRRTGWDQAAWLGFFAALLPNVTNLVATFTESRVITVDASLNRVVYLTGPAAIVDELASPLLAIAAIAIAVGGMRNARINPIALGFAGVLLLGAFGAAQVGDPFMTGGRLTALVVFLAAAFVGRSVKVLTGAGTALALLAVLSLVAAVVVPDIAAPQCDARKCGAFGALFTGVADNNNAFGLMVTLGIPVVWFGFARYGKTFAVLFTILSLASGSRTAQAAAVVTLAVLAVASSRRTATLGRALAVGGTAVAVAVVAITPTLDLSDDALTGRPSIWAIARTMIAENPVLGHGGDFWRGLVGVGVIPRAAGYSTHNQFLEILFVVGYAGLAAFILLMIALLAAHRGHTWQVCTLILPALICGIAERPWSLAMIDWMMWSLLVLFVVDFSRDSAESERRTPGLPRMARSGAGRLSVGGE